MNVNGKYDSKTIDWNERIEHGNGSIHHINVEPMRAVLLFVIISVLACSCAVYQHVPTQLNVPALKEKKQFQTNISCDFRKGTLQMNYAVSNSMLLFAEGFFYKSKNNGWFSKITLDEEEHQYEGRISEFKTGFGFYHHEGEASFSFLAGAGIGGFDYEHDYTEENTADYKYLVNGRTFEGFLQPTVGYQPFSNFEILISARIKHNIYYRINQFYKNDINHIGEKYDYLFYKPFTHYNFIEPAITFRVGPDNIKVQFQFFRSFCIEKNPPMYKELSLNYQIGTVFTFGGSKAEKQPDM